MLQSTEDWKSEEMGLSWQALCYAFTPVFADDSQLCVSEFGEWAGDAPLACSETVEWVFPDQEIRKILATYFQEIDEVVSVCTQISADESVVWSLLKSYDRKRTDASVREGTRNL